MQESIDCWEVTKMHECKFKGKVNNNSKKKKWKLRIKIRKVNKKVKKRNKANRSQINNKSNRPKDSIISKRNNRPKISRRLLVNSKKCHIRPNSIILCCLPIQLPSLTLCIFPPFCLPRLLIR